MTFPRAFRFIAANSHPDHDTLATFRRRFLDELAGLFVQVLEMAQEMKLLKLGTVCLDGTKIHANASRHSALSHGHIVKLQAHLALEVQELLALAEQADSASIPDGMNLPAELKLRQDRFRAMAVAKGKIAERGAQRYARERAEFDEKMDKRAAKEKDLGRKLAGKQPKPAFPGVRDTDQIQPHGRRVAHHADARRRLRASLQRAGCGGRGDDAGGGHGPDAGAQ